jgi:hypothetical protein
MYSFHRGATATIGLSPNLRGNIFPALIAANLATAFRRACDSLNRF